MKKYIMLMTFLWGITTPPLCARSTNYTIAYQGKTYMVQPLDDYMGKLEDGTWVKLVCIKKGMLGMPNITMPSYRGYYINQQQERCYVFVAQPEGTITYKNKKLKVYRTTMEQGFLSDGTKIKIECLPVGSLAKISITPEYRGTYTIEDPSGDKNKRQQCHVYSTQASEINK